MLKIEHIGIAVKNIENANKLFAALLGTEPYKTETVESEMVTTSFFKTKDSKIELLETSDAGSPVAKFIEKRGEGIHHIAFEVEDIYESIKNLKAKGFIFISEEPKKGADNKLICFIHPKSANGVLIELCQEIR
jgi:methylmalonyl-CoA/ethylmalonyl-CoA epimerase